MGFFAFLFGWFFVTYLTYFVQQSMQAQFGGAAPTMNINQHLIRGLLQNASVIILFLYQPVKVEGTSMLPRLSDQTRIFINKFVYRLEEIHRGDVVVFRYPGDPTKSYIKRVIGLPGDTVEIHRGEVFVNGEKLQEPYVIPEYRGSQSAAPWQVAPRNYYVLGDHRNSSNDSRVWGTVPRSYIYGKAELIYWPIGRWGLLD